MSVQGYRDLVVWQKAVDLIVEVYGVSRCFPREELNGITSQIRRAAVSVSSNIAEGSGRGSTPNLTNFLSHSRGSVKEVESLLLVSIRLGFLTEAAAGPALALAEEVSKMLTGLRKSLTERSNQRAPRVGR